MQKITPPIKFNETNTTVNNLQEALLFLLGKNIFTTKEPPNTPTKENFKEWLALLQQEKIASLYGEGTKQLVATFQIQQSIGDNFKGEIVEEATANKMNEVLASLGAFDSIEKLKVFGVVRNEFGELLNNVSVQVFDKDIRSEQLLGSVVAERGSYEVVYNKDQFQKAEKQAADILVKLVDSAGKELHKTAIFYNAANELEVNINLKNVNYKGPSEWELLTSTVTPLLENLSPLELREDEQFQDISFLAGESGHSQLVISFWIVSHHLADKTTREQTPLAAPVLFGFLRQGQPALVPDTLLPDIQHPEKVELLKDKILRELSNISSAQQKQLLEKALADNLIPASIRADIDAIVETLQKIKLRYTMGNTFGPGKGTIEQLLQLTPAFGEAQIKAEAVFAMPGMSTEQEKFISEFSNHSGPISEFWKKLEADKVFTPEVIKDVKLNFELGALTRNHIPLVAALSQQFKTQQLTAKRDLAKLDRQDWVATFKLKGADGNPIGVPANIDGETEEKKYQQYGVILEQRFERAYPTTSFMARLDKNEKSPVAVKKDVVNFLNNNPSFHLDRFRIDHYLDQNKDALDNIENKEATVQQLKSIQRVFKLKPTHQAVDALLTNKIESAQQIYFMGKEQFVTSLKDSGINKIESKKIYYKAENAYAMTLTLYGNYNHAVNGLVPAAASSFGLSAEEQAKLKTLPNLQTLFGSLDYCECTQCRSVYSPAAHFVDILRFLGDRNTNGTSINLNKKVKQVLLERRPDLGEMELSCENTNTPLPYIDLVNEILEDVASPPVAIELNMAIEPDLTAGTINATVRNELIAKNIPVNADAEVYTPDSRSQWAIRDKQHAYKLFKSGGKLQILSTKQTHLSAAELRANPEYTNTAAYDKLAVEVFPFNLPFNLWHLQSKTYLTHLGLPQPKLFELFQQKLSDDVTLAPTTLQVDAAWLGINETAYKIITGTDIGKQPWNFWGLLENGNNLPHPDTPRDATTNVSGTWVDVLSHVSILLHRTQLTYKELLQLLEMQYINATGSIFINDNTDSNAANCDTTTFTIVGLTADALDKIHRFVRLWKLLACEMWELDTLLPDANPDINITDKKITDLAIQNISQMKRMKEKFGWSWPNTLALYNNIDHSIYKDRSKPEAPPIQTLYQQLFRNKLVDATAVFPENPNDITGPMKGDGTPAIPDKIPGILAAFRISEEDLNLIVTDLSLTTASALDWAVLSSIYRTTIFAKAVGLNIYQFLRLKNLSAANPFANTTSSLAFIELVEKIGATEFTIPALDYLLTHHYKTNTGIALEDKTILFTITQIREGLQKMADDIFIKAEETPEAYIKSKLGLLPTITKDTEQSKALAIINGTWVDTATENRNTLIDKYFAGVVDLTVAKTNFAAMPPDGAGMKAAERFLYFQPALQSYLLQTGKDIFIKQKIAEVFQLEAAQAAILLLQLQIAGSANTLLQHLNNPTLLAKKADGSYQLEISETNFAYAFKSLRLLHKNAWVINKIKMKADELNWWLSANHANDMNWPHPKDFPTDTSTTVSLVQWNNLVDFFSWKNKLPLAEITAFEFLDAALNVGIVPAENIELLSKLTAWEETDIADLAAAFHWNVKQEFKKPASLIRLSNCQQALKRLGVNAARATGWAKATPTASEAESMKQTVKSKYDLTQWQQIIKPLQDVFREQKRDALVSWLMAQSNPNWIDANALYSYFLIDVEMSACMLTSRLKQAAASAQLFVQRCLMNLEMDIAVRAEKTDPSDALADTKWKQWKWMKYYRVWEANRKVFLYPENWIEPELRDEKSPFFKELENELMQNDINKETAEQAYLNYLEKLDKVANLEISTIYHEVLNATESVLHVFGRTRSSLAPEYFYRKRINGGRWTAWEKVDLEIAGNHLVVGIHNRRLHLLWPQFLEKAEEPTSFNIPNASSGDVKQTPIRYWEMRLFWSELKKGKWTPKVLSDSFIKMHQVSTGGNNTENIQLRVRLAANIQVLPYATSDTLTEAPSNLLLYNKIGQQINYDFSANKGVNFGAIISPPNSHYQNNLILHENTNLYFYYGMIDGVSPLGSSATPHQGASSILLLQNSQAGVTHSVIDATARSLPNYGSFFMWDPNRSYLVDYVINRTIGYRYGEEQVTETRAFEFFIHYHPFVELFIRELNIWGIKGLLNRRIQVAPQSIPAAPPLFNFIDYKPDATNVVKNYELPDKTKSYPIEDVDFSYKGAYSPYNWELFFHAPFHIANKLASNQRFEEALEWYHYIFNPTNIDNAVIDINTPQQKFWITKPFYETTKADYYKQKIENLLLAIAKGDSELKKQVDEWRDNPFNPHLIARMRTVAYQKSILIKYIKTIIAWADQQFSRNTIETINEATQLYIVADAVLGPRPKSIPKKINNPTKTFYQLEQEGIDVFGNVLVEVENLLPTITASGTMGEESPELPRLDVLYFCIPNNEKLLSMWDMVADRLFKIRHCMNIEGMVQQLPLFDPPIDPRALVSAAAGGLDISSALAAMNAPMPLYRFNFMIQKAMEICNEVKSLGSALLSALEKKDAEAFAILRSNHELNMMDAVRDLKNKQIEESIKNWEAVIEGRKVNQERKVYYEKLITDGWNTGETIAFGLSTASTIIDVAIAAGYIISGGLKLIPTFLAGAAGFGGTPTVSASMGGEQIGNGAEMAARTLQSIAAALDKGASLASTVASYTRRAEEWDFQKRLAEKELPQINKQIAAADIRKQMADIELRNHDRQKENLEKELAYMRTKFTNQELYDWMINQITTVYFQSYQLAFDLAKRAERCFRYELGLSDSNYIQFGYWDSLKKGLLSGEKLYYDLKRLETAYYEQNRREYELTKHISLAQLDPVALLKLRQNGECLVDVPEILFDMDYPGHYFRRIKSVSLSIPCIAGPYSTIACTLTLTSNKLRKDSALSAGKYERDFTIDDPRFRDEMATIQSIATSSAQNDSGLFELNFRDERYLPFEGAGAISNWQIKLNKDFAQFDLSTIADVIIHLKYTAREGGDALKTEVVKNFNTKMNAIALSENKKGLFRVYDVKREFATEWHKFLHPATTSEDQQLVLNNLQDRLSYFTRPFPSKKVSKIELVALVKDSSKSYKFLLSPLGNVENDLSSGSINTAYKGLLNALIDKTGSEVDLNSWTIKMKENGAANFKSLPADAIEELFLITQYTIA
jgi:hypothetical protein